MKKWISILCLTTSLLFTSCANLKDDSASESVTPPTSQGQSSQLPEVSETPEISEAPEVSEKPETSEKPEVSEKPEPSETPEVSEEPELPPEGECAHADKNSDDTCDFCYIPLTVTLDF